MIPAKWGSVQKRARVELACLSIATRDGLGIHLLTFLLGHSRGINRQVELVVVADCPRPILTFIQFQPQFIMALPRALPLGRFLCSRVNSPHLRRAVSLPCQTLVPCRQFLLGSRQKKGNEDSSASDPEIQGSKYGRSVAIVHMSPHATRSEIETLLTNSGLKMYDPAWFVHDATNI